MEIDNKSHGICQMAREACASLENVLACAQKGCSKPAVAICHYSSRQSQAWMEDLTESAAKQESILIASLVLCSEHADAFKAPIKWTFTDNRSGDEADLKKIRRGRLSLAHSETMGDSETKAAADEIEAADSFPQSQQNSARQEDADHAEVADREDPEEGPEASETAEASAADQSSIPLVRAEDMEDTPLLQRAFRSISG